jgi:hypothetical protein
VKKRASHGKSASIFHFYFSRRNSKENATLKFSISILDSGEDELEV